jgi:hypothetical protein
LTDRRHDDCRELAKEKAKSFERVAITGFEMYKCLLVFFSLGYMAAASGCLYKVNRFGR